MNTNMKTLMKLNIALLFMALCTSCGKTTEQYAMKEHGMQFDDWTLNYTANDYGVYWPTLKMNSIDGSLTEIQTEYNWSGSRIIWCDTTSTKGVLHATIMSYKSKHDAKYHNAILFKVSNGDNRYRSKLAHSFIITNGSDESITFSTESNEDHNFVPNADIADQIIAILCENKPISITVSFKGHNIAGEYEFEIYGSPKLKDGLKINQEREILANEEFDKVDRTLEKELIDLLQ